MFMNRYNGIDKVWTVEMIDRLREHRAAGLSATVTAERISGEFVPVTRNAVCGKIHRLGLSAPMVKRAKVEKPKKPRTLPSSRPSRLAAPQFVPSPALNSPQNVDELDRSKNCDMMALEDGMCRWPEGGDVRDGLVYCGNPTSDKSRQPYCAVHARINERVRTTHSTRPNYRR